MTFTTELLIWFAFVVPGQVFSILSLHRARFILYAVCARHAPADVIDDSQHVANTSLLLAVGWLVFLVVGLLGLLSPRPVMTPPTTPVGALILWGLLSAVGVWALMTVGDYVYTRRVWKRASTHSAQ